MKTGLVQGVIVFTTLFLESSTTPLDSFTRFANRNFSAFFVDPTARFSTANFSTFFVDSSTAPVDPTARFTTANFSTFFVDSSTAIVNSTTHFASRARNVEQALNALAKENIALARAMNRTAALTGVANEAFAEASRKIGNAIKQELLKGAVQEFVFKTFDANNALVADAIRVTLKALTKVTEIRIQYYLVDALNWMKTVRSNFSVDLEDINAALNDNPEDLEDVIINLINSTRDNFEYYLSYYIRNLDTENVSHVKLVIRNRFEIVWSNYDVMIRALINLLPDDAGAEDGDRSILTRYRGRYGPLCSCRSTL